MRTSRRDVDWDEWRAECREDLMEMGLSRDAAELEAARAERRARTRTAWVHGQLAAWRAAMEHCDAAWMKLVRDHPDEDEDFDPPPEQAEVDRLLAQIRAIADHDRWPRHLHWGGI